MHVILAVPFRSQPAETLHPSLVQVFACNTFIPLPLYHLVQVSWKENTLQQLPLSPIQRLIFFELLWKLAMAEIVYLLSEEAWFFLISNSGRKPIFLKKNQKNHMIVSYETGVLLQYFLLQLFNMERILGPLFSLVTYLKPSRQSTNRMLVI